MKVGVTNIKNRIGQLITLEILSNDILDLGSILVEVNSGLNGIDVGSILKMEKTGITMTDDLDTFFDNCDIIVDFSKAELTTVYARIAAEKHKIFISGTPGLSDKQIDLLKTHGEKTVIVWSNNMSLGINLLKNLIEQAASILRDDYDIDIIDFSNRKKDRIPSKTAISLGKAIAKAKNWDPNTSFVKSGNPRKEKEIHFSSIRSGTGIEEQSVIFSGIDEVLEIKHKCISKAIFVKGLMRALFWACDKSNGFYTMQDVLKLS